MSNSESTIHASHGLDGDTSKLEKYYADWASRYDDDVRREEYGGPRAIASMAVMVADSFLGRAPKAIRVLDAGCGTGLAGLELKRKGFEAIDGFDLSQEMCDIANDTGVYRELAANVDLNVDQAPVFSKGYDLIVCCGVFTLGHVEPDGLKRLASYLADGGYLIVSTRKSYFDGTDFDSATARIEAEGVLERVATLKNAAYIAEEGAHYWIYRKGSKPN